MSWTPTTATKGERESENENCENSLRMNYSYLLVYLHSSSVTLVDLSICYKLLFNHSNTQRISAQLHFRKYWFSRLFSPPKFPTTYYSELLMWSNLVFRIYSPSLFHLSASSPTASLCSLVSVVLAHTKFRVGLMRVGRESWKAKFCVFAVFVLRYKTIFDNVQPHSTHISSERRCYVIVKRRDVKSFLFRLSYSIHIIPAMLPCSAKAMWRNQNSFTSCVGGEESQHNHISCERFNDEVLFQ